MRYEYDEEMDEVVVAIDEDFLYRAMARRDRDGRVFGALAPLQDQLTLLGMDWPPIKGWPSTLVGQRIPRALATAVIALGDRRNDKWLKLRAKRYLGPYEGADT